MSELNNDKKCFLPCRPFIDAARGILRRQVFLP